MTTEPEAKGPSFLSGRTLALVRSIIDRIVPAEGRLPGAGALGVADYIDRVVGESTELRGLLIHGLSQAEIDAQAGYSTDFADLTDDQKDETLRRVESEEPEFFEALVRQTYNGYYTDRTVIEGLGLEARPPQPRGHELIPGDLSLLENVRKRGRAYREV